MTTDPQPTRYRHRAEEVEAVQWTGSNADALRDFCGPDFDEIELDDRVDDPDQTAAVREANHGTWRGLAPGDWVVKLDGGLYEFSAADFAEQYEPAVSVPVQPPATRADVAERIAVALYEAEYPGFSWRQAHSVDWEQALERAAAVLAVLPPPADRTAVLNRAADFFRGLHSTGTAITAQEVEQELRRMADEEQQSDTETHSCSNCEGIDSASCLMNPDRPKRLPMDPVHILGIEADEEQPATEAPGPETEWRVQTRWHNGDWRDWSRRISHGDALDEFERVEDGKHAWRLMRVTTSYAVEAEHSPDPS